MDFRRRAYLSVLGGLLCSAVGSHLGALVVWALSEIRAKSVNPLEAASGFTMVLLFAATTAVPFGLIVGIPGSWWLAGRMTRTESARRVFLESAGMGALLGATYPVIEGVLGWGPWQNVVFALPISIGVAVLCGILLASVLRTLLLRREPTSRVG